MSGRIRISPIPEIINGTWRIGKKLGSGSFGKIYLGSRDDSLTTTKRSSSSPPEVAIKIEPVEAAHPQLLLEAKVCRRLQGAEGVPLVYAYGTEGGWNYMAIDYLGPSLEDLFQLCGRVFTFHTTALLALQMLQRVETLHGKGYLHRDLKPDNFLMGRTASPNQNIVHMIDFGLAKPFRGSRGQHIPYRDGKSLTGTARYASINTHIGIEQSRRDDIEGLAFVLVYFSKGHLPWQGLKAVPKKDRHEGIMRTKLQTSPEELCKGCPKEFLAFLRHARSLEFSTKPDYVHLRRCLQECLMSLNNARELCFVASTTASGSGPSNTDSSGFLPSSRKTSRQSPKKTFKLCLPTSSSPLGFASNTHVVTSPLYEFQGLSARSSTGKSAEITVGWDPNVLFDWQYMRHQRQLFLDSEHALIRCQGVPSLKWSSTPFPIDSRCNAPPRIDIRKGIVEESQIPVTPKNNGKVAVPVSPQRIRSKEANEATPQAEAAEFRVFRRDTQFNNNQLNSPLARMPILPTPTSKLLIDGNHAAATERHKQFHEAMPFLSGKSSPLRHAESPMIMLVKPPERPSRRVTKDDSWLVADKSDRVVCASTTSSTTTKNSHNHHNGQLPELTMSVELPNASGVSRRLMHRNGRGTLAGTSSPSKNRRRSSGSRLKEEVLSHRVELRVREVSHQQPSMFSGRATRNLSGVSRGGRETGRLDVSGPLNVLRDDKATWDHNRLTTVSPATNRLTTASPTTTRQLQQPQRQARPIHSHPENRSDADDSTVFRQLTRATTGLTTRDVGRLTNPLSPKSSHLPMPSPGMRNPPIVISTLGNREAGRVDRTSFRPVLSTALSRDRSTAGFNNRMVRTVVQA